MRPIIGVVCRFEKISEVNNAMVIYENVIKAVKQSGGEVIGLVDSQDSILRLYDGIILQGGNDISLMDLKIINYCYINDIPLLGICLGMQMLALAFDGQMLDLIDNRHMDKINRFVHSVTLDEASKLYDIVRQRYILVNSRHYSYIKNTKLNISGISDDGYIEAIEDKNKRFFVGLQWHPETTFEYDIVSKKIFKTFIDECRKGKR